jgi:hypothetical protein
MDAAAADGRAYDQMATTNADWTALDSDGNRMPVDVYANCRKFWFGAAQGQVEGPPQTFPAGGAHPHQHDLPLFGAAQGQVAGPPQTFPAVNLPPQHLPGEMDMELSSPTNADHEPAALPMGWRQAVAPDGRTYYENDMTKVTQWEHPGAAAAEHNLPLQLPTQQPMAAAVMP